MSSTPSVKALVLAAGLGTRLRPLTDRLAKPLFPFFGPSLLGLALWRLHAHGLRRVAVNTHHLGAQVAEHAKGFRHFFDELKISHEEELLGTGGALIPLAPWIGNDHILIYNGDTISSVDLRRLIEGHERSGAVATMVLLRHHEQGKTPVWTEGHRVTAIGGKSTGVPATFTGIHILSPRLRERLPKKVVFHHIIDAYQEALREGELVGIHWHEGLWADLGTPGDYWRSLVDFATTHDGKTEDELGLLACNRWLGEPFAFQFESTHPKIVGPVSYPRGPRLPNDLKLGPFAFLQSLPTASTGQSIAQCALLGTYPKSGIASSHTPRLILEDLVVEVPR